MSNTYEKVASVRFAKVGKLYHFDAGKVQELNKGDRVIVETARGWQIGQVAQIITDFQAAPDLVLKSIERLATPRDLMLRQMWESKQEGVVSACKKRIGELGIVGAKCVDAEYSFDGQKLTILFSTETEEKVDLKSLRQDMQKMFSPAQVELRQIGPRDVAKVICGMGACGLESRCCSQFLCEFSSISIRMAKEQGISLTPTEITGMCGRLRCCLIYEFETYTSARKSLPKRNKRVITPQGEAKVVDVVPLQERVVVQFQDNTIREYAKEEIQVIGEEGHQGNDQGDQIESGSD